MRTVKRPIPSGKTQRAKIHKVLDEFKTHKLKTPSGILVKKRKQAVAIALSEARGISNIPFGISTNPLRHIATGLKNLKPEDKRHVESTQTLFNHKKRAMELRGLPYGQKTSKVSPNVPAHLRPLTKSEAKKIVKENEKEAKKTAKEKRKAKEDELGSSISFFKSYSRRTSKGKGRADSSLAGIRSSR